jgi:hypothetical protein
LDLKGVAVEMHFLRNAPLLIESGSSPA